MRRLLFPGLVLLLCGAGSSQSHQFQITLEHFVGGPASLDIEVRLFTLGTDVVWPDSVHHITSNPGEITVSALEPGFCDVYIRADRFLRKKLSAVPFGEPGPVDAYATGSTQYTVFWPEYVGATGYYVYRATTPDGFDFDSPLNATPVDTPTYEGSFFRWYTDTGLATGQTYYYTVRAVRSGNPPNLSAPGEPDDAYPTADAIPWHTRNPAQIIPKIRALAPENTGGRLVSLAPDATIYDTNFTFPLPPSGFASPDMNVLDSPEGEYVVIPHPAVTDEAEANDPDNTHSGPYRRVIAAKGYRKAMLEVRLPSSSGVRTHPKVYGTPEQPEWRHRWNYLGTEVEPVEWSSSEDIPHIYIGASGPGFSVDAGLRIFHIPEGADEPTEWQAFLFASPNHKDEAARRDKFSWYAVPPVGSAQHVLRSDDGDVRLLVYLGTKARVPTLFLKVEQPPGTQKVEYSTPLPKRTNVTGVNVSFRRVASIAQTFRRSIEGYSEAHPDYFVGYVLGVPAQHSKLDLSLGGLYRILNCRLFTATQDYKWDAGRLDPDRGLRWFPKGPGKDHIIWFEGEDAIPPQSGVDDREKIRIELRP